MPSAGASIFRWTRIWFTLVLYILLAEVDGTYLKKSDAIGSTKVDRSFGMRC